MAANETTRVQFNFRAGDALINVYADTADQATALLKYVQENVQEILTTQALLAGGKVVVDGGLTGTPAQAPGSNGTYAPAPPQPSGEPFTRTDKWGNEWTYNAPGAPITPRGPAVKKTAQKRDNSGTYSKWFDPAAGPLWFEERKPKVDKADQWEGDFVR